MNTYTVDYFINKFVAIPEEKWTSNYFRFGDSRCAQGHCMTPELIEAVTDYQNRTGALTYPNKEALKFGRAFDELRALVRLFGNSNKVAAINNGYDTKYLQPTPKQRILAALKDVKAQQSKEQPAPKEKIKYVAVPVTLTEQVKELILQ